MGPADLDWPCLAAGGAVAQLAVEVVPPGVQVAVGADGRGMLVAQADLLPGESVGSALGLADLDWRAPAGGGAAVAQLAVVVPSPGVEAAVGSDGRGMLVAQADLCPGESVGSALGLADLDWPCLAAGGAVAQLALAVVSPSVEVAVGSDGRGMKAA